MPNISKLYDIFAEEGFHNAIACKVEGIESITYPTPIYLQKWDSRRPLFTYLPEGNGSDKENTITITFCQPLELEQPEPPSFKYLFWLERNEKSDSSYIFKYIECGSVKPLPQLDIAFNDSTRINLNVKNSDHFIHNIGANYIFDAGKYKLLLVKAWQNGTRNWNVYGMRSENERDIPRLLDVALAENKNKEPIRLITKERYSKEKFPSHFDEIDILAYETINIVEMGKAKEAHDSLIERVSSGDAVMALWDEYSNIELKNAKKESEELGNISYECCSRGRNGRTMLSMHVNTEQAYKLKELAGENARMQVVQEADNSQSINITLLSFNTSSREATVEDEMYKLPAKGRLRLSTKGDEIVKSRREQARTQLLHGNNIAVRNLLFAIENETASMFNDNHAHIPAISKKTQAFLKEKYGIERLTKNQEEAVEIALNNRKDITVIQGPPGTGKTTVIAAICHRLLELRDKQQKNKTNTDNKTSKENKAILASAFQNDTIEHLASKIYTHGLPTVKIGKRKSGFVAEQLFIDEMDKHLDAEIAALGGANLQKDSVRLSKLAYLFEKEKNFETIMSDIEEIIPSTSSIEGIEFDKLNDIKRAIRTYKRNADRDMEVVKELPESESAYDFEDGFVKVMDFLSKGYEMQDDDVALLEAAPEMNPTKEFLDNLVRIKKTVLSRFQETETIVNDELFHEILQWLQSTIETLIIHEESNYENENDFICAVLDGLKSDLRNNTDYIRKSLQHYGEIVAATNQLAGSNDMKIFNIENVILEEAARSNPLDLLIPMVRATNRIILVGDQFQLPHLLETDIAEESLSAIDDIDEKKEKRRLYEKSLFGIIFDNVKNGARRRCITLQEQFRMHPTIGNFISDMYYDGQLSAGSANLADTKLHNLSLPWAKNKTMIFCNVGSSKPERSGKSKYRPAEAERIMSLVDEIRTDSEFNNLSIGIITFYSRQVTALFEEASKPEHGYAVKTKDGYDIHPYYKTLSDGQEKLRIGSVDSFQGKEFDVVILSTVRSNNEKREEDNEKKVFGFLTLSNRLNVAFSRAKKLLIVAGDESMFDDDYARRHVPGLYEFNVNISRQEYGNRI